MKSKKTEKQALLLLVSLIFCISTFAQKEQTSNLISYENMLSDFRYYVDLLENTHVDPYTPMGGKLKFKVKVAEFEQKLTKQGSSSEDFTLLLSQFSSQLNDLHTYFYMNNNGTKVSKQMPFYCKPASDGIFIKVVKEGYEDLYGAKIIAVNNKPIDELIEEIKIYTPCENISGAKKKLAWSLVNYSYAKPLFNNMGKSLQFRMINSKMDTITEKIEWLEMSKYNKMKWHQSRANIKMKYIKGIFGYQFVDSNKNIMYFLLKEMFAQEVIQMMRTYKINNGNWPESILNQYYPEIKAKYGVEEGLKRIPYFTEAFRNMLAEMKTQKSEYLILDLTQNTGGYSQMALPALYLLYGDKCFSPEIDGKYIKRISQLYLDKLNTNIEQYNINNNTNFEIGDYNVSSLLSKDDNSDEACRQSRINYLKSLDKNNFGWKKYIDDLNGKALYTPKIIVLSSSSTASAAYHFLYKLYKAGNITVIGVASSQAGNTPMEETSFLLPKLKIKGSISNAYQIFFPEGDEKARVFKPDFPLNWIDFQKKGFSKYTELEIAIDLIKSGKVF